jgi:hypothetical protein
VARASSRALDELHNYPVVTAKRLGELLDIVLRRPIKRSLNWKRRAFWKSAPAIRTTACMPPRNATS